MTQRRILILKGSPRTRGNSAALAEQVAAGASEAGAAVQVFDRDWNYRMQWPVLAWPGDDINQKAGLAVDPERALVYVTDPGNARVLVYRTDGTFVATWGERGTGANQFLSPTGIAVGPDGRVYVADGDAHRVLILPPAGA